MTKQNLLFITPFALNLLAYLLIWNVFFSDEEATTTSVEDKVPAAFLEEIGETNDGAYIINEKDYQLMTAMKNQ